MYKLFFKRSLLVLGMLGQLVGSPIVQADSISSDTNYEFDGAAALDSVLNCMREAERDGRNVNSAMEADLAYQQAERERAGAEIWNQNNNYQTSYDYNDISLPKIGQPVHIYRDDSYYDSLDYTTPSSSYDYSTQAQIDSDADYARQLQSQYDQIDSDAAYARELQSQYDADYARELQYKYDNE